MKTKNGFQKKIGLSGFTHAQCMINRILNKYLVSC